MEEFLNIFKNKTMDDRDLCVALERGDFDEFKEQLHRLIKKNGKLDVDYISEDRTMLQKACYFGHLHIVKYLIQIGADINKMDSLCFTPLLCALWKNHGKVAKYLIDEGAITRYLTMDGRKYSHCTNDPDMIKLLKKIEHKFEQETSYTKLSSGLFW